MMLIGFSAVPAAFGHIDIGISLFLTFSYGLAILGYIIFMVLYKIDFKFSKEEDELRDKNFGKIRINNFRILQLVIIIYDIIELVISGFIALRILASLFFNMRR